MLSDNLSSCFWTDPHSQINCLKTVLRLGTIAKNHIQDNFIICGKLFFLSALNMLLHLGILAQKGAKTFPITGFLFNKTIAIIPEVCYDKTTSGILYSNGGKGETKSFPAIQHPAPGRECGLGVLPESNSLKKKNAGGRGETTGTSCASDPAENREVLHEADRQEKTEQTTTSSAPSSFGITWICRI